MIGPGRNLHRRRKYGKTRLPPGPGQQACSVDLLLLTQLPVDFHSGLNQLMEPKNKE